MQYVPTEESHFKLLPYMFQDVYDGVMTFTSSSWFNNTYTWKYSSDGVIQNWWS